MPKTPLAVDLLLDSGAFSAWNRGTTIDIKKYIAYVKRLEDYLFSYVTLDVLPGGQESKRTSEAVEAGAAESYKNHLIMKNKGLTPIPVFHQGESIKWLEQMLKDSEPYIGLSTRKDLWTRNHVQWLDQVFPLITNKSGQPIIRTHGFGVTSPGLLLRYPWYTVDSTTWSMTPGYGRILIPVYVNGVADYTRVPVRIITSGITSKASANRKNQFEGMGPMQQQYVKMFLDEIGITLPEIRYETNARRKAVLYYYMKLAEAMQNVHYPPGGKNTAKPVKHNLRVMFATALKNKDWSALMVEMGARTRLLSFYEIQGDPDEALIEYVTTGSFGKKGTRAQKARFESEGYLNYRRLKLHERGKAYAEDGTS